VAGTGRRRSATAARVLGVVLLLAVTAALCYLAWQRNVALTDPVRTSAAAAPAAPAEVPSPTATTPARPTAVFLGGSTTQGQGASTPATRWSSLVASARGWDEVDLGLGGTGYVTTAGPEGCGLEFCPNVETRVADAVARDPDVVVVSGGEDDLASYEDDPDTVGDAVATTFSELRRQLPRARLVAVGPSTPGAVDDAVEGLDADVRAAATAAGAEYVSLLEPDVLTVEAAAPGARFDDAGHRAIAERVLAAVP
jgi:lysophospholipase L1-like esterase